MLSPGEARRSTAFYGWYMVAVCTIIRGFTAPGQTIGISAFTDDLISSLDTNRSKVSTAYMIGTLAGAAVLPFVGRWVDRAGIRRTLTVVGISFSVAIMATATVQNLVMLTFAFFGLRMLGQGSMTLIGTQGVVMWFEKRRGFALAVSNAGTTALLALAPLTFAVLIGIFGWRWTWVVLGLGILAIVLPIARYAIVDRPSELGQVPDGRAIDQPAHTVRARSFTVGEALRTPAFWTLTGVAFMAGGISTALTFHNTDLLGEQGLSPTQAAAVFIPQLVGSVVCSFGIGALTDKMPARPLLLFGAGMLGLAAFLSTIAGPGVMAALYGLVLGTAGGSINALSGALYPKWFGVDHIGSIKGIASTANVAASAGGPLVLALGNDAADSYEPVVIVCAIAAGVMALIAFVVPTPNRIPQEAG